MTIIALEGKTASGKDSVAKFIEASYGIKQVVSYTTRPKRDYEKDGVEHHFITKDQMAELKRDWNSLLAYTKFPDTGFEYCATTADLTGDDIRTYIINPDGVEWLKKNRPDVNIISIYLDLSERLIKKRAKKRGDSVSNIVARLDSEREQFKICKKNKQYDYKINTRKAPQKVFAEVRKILDENEIKSRILRNV